MMELVVTLAIVGILMSVSVPSYYNIRIKLQERQAVTNMNIIRETFFQYFYRAHMAGNPHFPSTPDNEEKLKSTIPSLVPSSSQIVLNAVGTAFATGVSMIVTVNEVSSLHIRLKGDEPYMYTVIEIVTTVPVGSIVPVPSGPEKYVPTVNGGKV